MKYFCTVIDVIDEFDEVTLKINNSCISGMVGSGVTKKVGDNVVVEMTFFDDLKITPSDQKVPSINRKEDTFAYSLFGILDIDNAILRSEIDFELGRETLYDYGYLDEQMVRVDVVRIDIEFL